MQKKSGHPTNGLINIQNTDDNECFKCCLVRYLIPENRHPVGITETDKDYSKRFHFKDIKLPVKTRDIHKIKNKENSIRIFLMIKKNIQSIYHNNAVKKNMLTYY